MMSPPFCCICVMALTCRLIQGQTGTGLLEQQFKRADSALSILLERPETRMKEIAPVEDLFREALANRPEFMTVLRTNSKGLIVNIVSRDDSLFGRNSDVSSKEWYSAPQESKRPYYSPLIQENRSSFLFWSKPILVRNSLGMSRFGGVIAAKISLPVCFKLFAAQFQGPFQILLKGKEFYYLSWDEHAPYEEKTVRIPRVSGLTARFISKKQTPEALPAHFDSTAKSKIIANKTFETQDTAAGTGTVPAHSTRKITPPAPLKPTPTQSVLKKNMGLLLAGTAVIVAVFITATMMWRRWEKRETLIEGAPADVASPKGLAKELDDAIRQSLDNDALEEIRTQEMEEKVRSDLMQELKREVAENEADILRNNVRAEMKEDIRTELQKNEAQAIRAVVERELTDSWREEIREKYHGAIYKQELENLKKIVHEKLIEKEMPLLVETYRKELSKEIRQKIIDTFSGQIERSERQALQEEIAQKLRQTEYERIVQEEKEKMRILVKGQITEKEMEPLRALLREELTAQMRAQVREEAETVRHRLREEEHRRINDEERPGIIEAERNRLREQEAPGLLKEIRAELREEEIEAMHARVKTEIYTETVQTLKAGLEERYRGVLDKKLEECREAVEKQVRSEIKGRIKSEYQNLLEHVEQLSHSMGNVEALDSLSQTITLLHDEKKKYKYFNLNTAQTESLLEYLKRVQNRFNIFLDKLDEAIREMVLKINIVMNTLDNEE